MRTITTERVPIYVWGEIDDPDTLAQARNIANLPFAHHHVALMPDAHVGFGMPIGGVFAAAGQVVPHAVGLDIGCGVRAFKTDLQRDDVEPVLDDVLHAIMRDVPQGFDWHHESQAHRTDVFDEVPDSPVLRAEKARAERQAGTLGGGNHFIELQQDADGFVWVMIHCGSRNVGKQVAEHYDAIARDLNRREGSPVPPQWGLAHLDVRSAVGSEYLAAMGWCLRFAKENRRLIAESVRDVLRRRFGSVSFAPDVDVHHNYASTETHFGRDVIVHRKGAVHARGTVVVPGSMGTASYIAEGLANPDSFESCSHGAGRALGRREAMRRLKRDEVLRDLERRGVHLAKGRQHDVAEEAPQAYKDIESVMAWQRDLVRPLVRLTPLGVVKG
ncbi:RtcB family protein [Coriobacteriia bacterium Es71-Z0120]|uniref:RtcB family protein n=1 Tax=Parvivirga hydrogeniphila TaxID=2939460 RepID=UPI0022608E36|nr:RtcB family protein [Parvivirga hydrogeniphila]MCL4078071.1 RtcB family protein [Parvivirga hydrogeniphila]